MVPLDYAMTQNNRASVLSDIASLPGEERGERLREALRCGTEAVAIFEEFQHAQYLEDARKDLRSLRQTCGADFAALWGELGFGDPPAWLDDDPSE